MSCKMMLVIDNLDELKVYLDILFNKPTDILIMSYDKRTLINHFNESRLLAIFFFKQGKDKNIYHGFDFKIYENDRIMEEEIRSFTIGKTHKLFTLQELIDL